MGDELEFLLMCGRFRLSRRKELIEEYFNTDPNDVDWSPRYNIAPTQLVPAIRQNADNPKRSLSVMQWGLIPSWLNASAGVKLFNARSETVAAKPSFRSALKDRRCLLPADAFYEWRKTGKQRQPFCFEVNEGELFAFAGIWESSRGSNGDPIETCCILTTSPNAVTSAVHDRMPVILKRDEYDLWLDAGLKRSAILDLLNPLEASLMRAFAVSTRVNNVTNDDEECSRPWNENTRYEDTMNLFG
jgi:putative SOS response-associated peptidase YedK